MNGDNGSSSRKEIVIVKNENGIPIFPLVDLQDITFKDLKVVIGDYFNALWSMFCLRSVECGSLALLWLLSEATCPSVVDKDSIPWADLSADPSLFIDTDIYEIPTGLGDPHVMQPPETFGLATFLDQHSTRKPTAPFVLRSRGVPCPLVSADVGIGFPDAGEYLWRLFPLYRITDGISTGSNGDDTNLSTTDSPMHAESPPPLADAATSEERPPGGSEILLRDSGVRIGLDMEVDRTILVAASGVESGGGGRGGGRIGGRGGKGRGRARGKGTRGPPKSREVRDGPSAGDSKSKRYASEVLLFLFVVAHFFVLLRSLRPYYVEVTEPDGTTYDERIDRAPEDVQRASSPCIPVPGKG